jgi:hypothetical protein
MVLRHKGDRGTGGTCVRGKMPYKELLCESDMKNTAPNITSLIRAIRPYGVSVSGSLKICRPRLKYKLHTFD